MNRQLKWISQMHLSKEDKQKIKILKIKLRKAIHRGIKIGIKFTKKVGLVTGLFLVSLCGKSQNNVSLKSIFMTAISEQRNNKELLVILEKNAKTDSTTNNIIQNEITNRINKLAEDFLFIRNDSLYSSIDKLKNRYTRNSEIRRNFFDAVGISQVSSHCLATQCAADYRALKSMGLEDIIPNDLRQNSALCCSYLKSADIKPFAHEVSNTDAAIKKFIKENKMPGGTLIFYPRDRYNYHAVSLDMPNSGFEYNDTTNNILTSSANKERKSVPISTSSFRAKAPGRKAIIVDKLEFFIALLEKHLEGKSLAEQTAILYHGGADEFLQHLYKSTNFNKKQIPSFIENIIKNISIYGLENDRARHGTYFLALVPLANNRRYSKNKYLLDVIENELDNFSSLDDKCLYLDKTLKKALVGMTKDEQKQFLDSLTYYLKDDSINIGHKSVIFAVYNFWQILNKHSTTHERETWHQVASGNNKQIDKSPSKMIKQPIAQKIKQR